MQRPSKLTILFLSVMTNVIKCLTKVTLIDNFQYQNQYVDIIKLDQRKNVQITDTNVYTSTIQDILFI
jgi:hypothetical protein